MENVIFAKKNTFARFGRCDSAHAGNTDADLHGTFDAEFLGSAAQMWCPSGDCKSRTFKKSALMHLVMHHDATFFLRHSDIVVVADPHVVALRLAQERLFRSGLS